MQLSQLTTEQRNPHSYHLDELSVLDILTLMNREDAKIIQAIQLELPNIEKVIQQTIHCLKNGGRLIYVGAGTSGRIGVLDAVECPPTFGMDPEKVVGLLAGGLNQAHAKEEAEDNASLGQEDMKKIHLQAKDMVIGLAASGRTPYVIGALDYAHQIHASTASIACNKQAKISQHALLPIEVNVGPEVLAGSTRLKAGTAQKMICNMISTASMVRLGKVYENLMVDVDVSNEKLYQRWLNIVCQATNCTLEQAQALYEPSCHQAKVAICMFKTGYTYTQAQEALQQHDGFIKRVLKDQDKKDITSL